MQTKTKIRLEDYESFLQNPHCKAITNDQLNQIICMHGFMKLHKRRKEELLEVLSHIDLLRPQRSTLYEIISPDGSSLSMDEVNQDLDGLEWHECPVQSLETLNSTHGDETNGVDGPVNNPSKRKPTAFEITGKKPRSKRTRRRHTGNDGDDGESADFAAIEVGVSAAHDDVSPLGDPLSSGPSSWFQQEKAGYPGPLMQGDADSEF